MPEYDHRRINASGRIFRGIYRVRIVYYVKFYKERKLKVSFLHPGCADVRLVQDQVMEAWINMLSSATI